MGYVALAFVSGFIVEALYALGVVLIERRCAMTAGLLSAVWGTAFLFGINESFRNHVAAAAWCIGLGLGTIAGVRIADAIAKDGNA